MELNIARSTKVNQSRLSKMKKRNECVEKLKKDALKTLQERLCSPENPAYQAVLKKLLMQGLIKLLEKEVYVRVREEDVSLVKRMCSDVEKEFTKHMAEAGCEYETKIHLLDDRYLGPEDQGECGGVIMFSQSKKITCLNTMHARLDLVFEELLPKIRAQLFPK